MSTGDVIQYPGLNRNSYLENNLNFPNIITCPSELVALSAALGYAQATGVPVCDYAQHQLILANSCKQCVIVHVDCGTLAMGQSIHNASVSRVPVLCFAGLSPFTQNGELLGSRTELASPREDAYLEPTDTTAGSSIGSKTYLIKQPLSGNTADTLVK